MTTSAPEIIGDSESNQECPTSPPDGELQTYYYFPSAVYTVMKPEFIDVVMEVSNESLKANTHDLNEIYPVQMSGHIADDPRLEEFTSFVADTAWNILASQGYAMNNFTTYFSEMWTQEHHKHSLMEQHVHGAGNQLLGFYFLETPENCSRAVFHDPRPGKVQINLMETDGSNATPASNMINFAPEPGMLLFSNAWLPHSFSRHASEEPIKFVHFNVGVQYTPQVTSVTPAAEII